MNPATDAKRPRRLEPVVEFVTLKGGVTIPVPELRLALDLEARGIPLATDADRQFVVPKDERLTTDDLVNIPRWRAGVLKPSTVHQELRVLRRVLNLAVRKRLLPSNPCWGVEFPVAVKSLFRPHYVSWSAQQRIEAEALRIPPTRRSDRD